MTCIAKGLGALRRAWDVKSAEELQRLIFLYLTENWSFAGTSTTLSITDEMSRNKKQCINAYRTAARD